MTGGSLPYGPMIALAMLAILALLLRWAFSSGHSVVERPAKAGRESDYGLLVPVATPIDTGDGWRMCGLLRMAGITGTCTITADGLRVLVFPQDAPEARRVLGQAAQP